MLKGTDTFTESSFRGRKAEPGIQNTSISTFRKVRDGIPAFAGMTKRRSPAAFQQCLKGVLLYEPPGDSTTAHYRETRS